MSPCIATRENYLSNVIASRGNLDIALQVHTLENARMLGLQVLTQKPVGLCTILLESNLHMWHVCFTYLREQLNIAVM